MQCLAPIQVKNPNLDMRGQNLYVSVPCSKCVACRRRRASHWSFRLNEELKVSSSCRFITLTYATPPITENGYPTLRKKDLQDFFKRLRHKTTNKLKYYAVGEYGTKTHRPHYHAIVFNLPQKLLQNPSTIEDCWSSGFITCTPSTPKRINYVVGYITKNAFTSFGETDDRVKEYSTMSKKLGINYLTPEMIRFYKTRKIGAIIKQNGEYMSMPRYYKEKIYEPNEIKEIANEWREINDKTFEELLNTGKTQIEIYKYINYLDKNRKKLKRQLI